MRSKKAILNIMSSLALQIITVICGFIIPRLIITEFGSNVNGLIESITQFLAYITLLESGFGPVVKATLYKPIANKDKTQIKNILKASEKFFRGIAVVFIIYLLLLSVVYPLIVNSQFSFVYTMSLVLIISISTFVEYFFGMTYKLYLQAEQKTYVTSIIQIIGYVLNTITIVLLVNFNASIHVVKLATMFIFILRPIVQNVYVRKKYNINLKDADESFKLKQKWDGLSQHIASVIHSNTDITILTLFSKITEVSVYSVYYIVIKGIKSIILAFTSGIEALLGDMIAKDENENLNKFFTSYEIIYHAMITLIFTCTIILIVPFISVYTQGMTDVNYIRPIFAYIIVSAEYICMIRFPYITIVYSAGDFRKTNIGAWIEAIVNIAISVILVQKYGLAGIAVGTFIAMLLRMLEFMQYASKHTLKRKLIYSLRWLFIIAVETLLIVLIDKLCPQIVVNNYVDWIIYAIRTGAISIILILTINTLLFKKQMKDIINIFSRIWRKNNGSKKQNKELTN